ncbi:MAG: MmgE/PrpD family protein [Albidovulum sp.]|nr:MmgE/PrpD family protein [Albidovulum sp.]
MKSPTRSALLAEWIAGLEEREISDSARIAAQDSVIDTVALCVAALETDYGRAAREAFGAIGQCSVWGLGEGADPYGAAAINGTCSHGEDFDNTFEGCPVHSGAVVIPALFSAGQHLGLSKSSVAKGLVVGIEIANRLGIVAGKGVHSAGFHPTAVLGTMGATAGVAAAMGQSASQIRDSLGVAGSMSAGIIEYLADGSWTKRMHAGWAAQSGIRAARMGKAGFRGPSTVFEGSHGLFAAFAPSIAPDFAPLTDSLGSEWQCARVAFKPYACGTMTQPYIDCAARLQKKAIVPEEIARIVCEVGEGTVHRLWEPLSLKQSPPTPYAAKFSSPYAVAIGLVHGDAGLAQFTDEALRDPVVLSLARKVSYEIDPDNEYPRNYTGHVKVLLRDGRAFEERQGQLRGGIKDPMSREEILAKARANFVFAGRRAESAESLREFARSLFESSGSFNDRFLRSFQD